MAANNIYRIVYHFEKGGKRVSDTQTDVIIASDSTFNSINTVLSNNSKTNNGIGSLVIETIAHVSAGFLS